MPTKWRLDWLGAYCRLWAVQICNTEGLSFATALPLGQWVAVDPALLVMAILSATFRPYTDYSTVTLHFTPGYTYMAPWADLTLAPAPLRVIR